jgi:lysophospholipase L1-like esterase
MDPRVAYEQKKKKTLKFSKSVLLAAFAFIAIGLTLLLCADMLKAPPADSSAPASSAEADSGLPPLSSDADAETLAGATDAGASDVPIAPIDATTPGAETADNAASNVGETVPDGEEPAAPDADAPPPGKDISATVAASNASVEKTAGEEAGDVPQVASIDTSETDDYFSNALFIGDSRTQGLLLYSNLGNANYYAARGLTVEQVFKKAVVDSTSGKLTVSDALSRRAFGKVYLMFGLNELGWNSADKFIEQYGLVIERVKETQPDAIIYVQSIMPVSSWKSAKDPVHNNPNIARFNEMIEQLANEKNVIYLNTSDGVADESGVLPDEASSDGIHLNKKYCIKWEEYLRAHEL